MKKVFFFVALIVLFSTAKAGKKPMGSFLKCKFGTTRFSQKSVSLKIPYIDNFQSTSSHYDSNGSHYDGTMNNTNMSFSKTDYLGNVMDVTLSVSGNTLSWSVNVVPGTGVNVGLHRLWIYDYNSDNFDSYADSDYEDPDATGYGNVTWSDSGTIDLSTAPTTLRVSFEYFSTDPSINTTTYTTATGEFFR
ncbi:hypothetical protein [Mucilaginibacter terrae]|uniref:Uncharacterized protein n=1 Tax=Mucilaginibacter terrae TaxID=1955052 RepID=A0ABU3GTD4_9SPHI|nr:hypothetical protein [Mucilaginibacter terrae]MDT3402910.1 hypothetical protein [Mucilaginibacter terrae]